tara:strand:- start:378 stop:605 length:228 start_codon:yes stop_codon:yes gene_type:complete
MTAAVPNITDHSPDDPEAKIAPTSVIPEIALAPDIKGVCKVEGTLDINSTPKNIDRTKTKKSKTICDSIIILLFK